MKTIHRFALALLAGAAALPGHASAQEFSGDRIRADISFLADDLLEGREAGERGYDLAALYVAKRFQTLGLKPGGENGSYYQNVPFVLVDKDADKPSALTINGTRHLTGADVIIGPSSAAASLDRNVEAVFVGYGLHNDALGIDDYA